MKYLLMFLITVAAHGSCFKFNYENEGELVYSCLHSNLGESKINIKGSMKPGDIVGLRVKHNPSIGGTFLQIFSQWTNSSYADKHFTYKPHLIRSIQSNGKLMLSRVYNGVVKESQSIAAWKEVMPFKCYEEIYKHDLEVLGLDDSKTINCKDMLYSGKYENSQDNKLFGFVQWITVDSTHAGVYALEKRNFSNSFFKNKNGDLSEKHESLPVRLNESHYEKVKSSLSIDDVSVCTGDEVAAKEYGSVHKIIFATEKSVCTQVQGTKFNFENEFSCAWFNKNLFTLKI